MKKILVKRTPMGSLDCLLSWYFTLRMQLKSVTSTTTKHQVSFLGTEKYTIVLFELETSALGIPSL